MNSDSKTSGKDTDSEAEVRQRTPHAKIKRMREEASMASHSLQLLAEEFRKICKPKIQKLKGGYSDNAMLVFNSWLKDIEMCVKETEDQFANELQILGWKVISIRPGWKEEANEALKTQFASQLCDPYLAAMACIC